MPVYAIFVSIALLAQCPEPDVYRLELLPLVQQIHTSESYAAAIEELTKIAEDTSRCWSTRSRAISLLPGAVPHDVKRRIEAIAESPPDANSRINAYEPFGSQDLHNSAVAALWRFEAASLECSEERKKFWLRSLQNQDASRDGRVLSSVAVSALMDFGDRQLLPRLLEIIRDRYGNDGYGKDLMWLAKKKVELIELHKTRFGVLEAALMAEDQTEQHLLQRWAISELADLGTSEAFEVLIEHARHLQRENYDRNDQRSQIGCNWSTVDPTMRYRSIIAELREHGWTTDQLESVGLFPGKYFSISGEGPA